MPETFLLIAGDVVVTGIPNPPPVLRRVVTADGYVLDGALQLPPAECRRQARDNVDLSVVGGIDFSTFVAGDSAGPFTSGIGSSRLTAPGNSHDVEHAGPSETALILVHGTGSNFYASGPLEVLARNAAVSGMPALRINTRGHDGMASIAGLTRSLHGGATFEKVSDCRYDLTAWIDLVVASIAPRVILAGHSMGGVKSIYSQAVQPHPAVVGVMCLSPPRFNHEHWMRHPLASPFRETCSEATIAVKEGRPEQLLMCRQPVPFVATAQGFIDKYGPSNEFDIIRLLPSVACPVLVLLGSRTLNSSPAFDSLPNEMERLVLTGRNLNIQLLDGEDMSYSTVPDAPWIRLHTWINQLTR